MRLNPVSPFRSRARTAARFEADSMQPLEQRALLAVDFVYNDLAVPNALPGGTVQANSTISNAGDTDTSAATPYTIKFFLSLTDNVLDGADVEVGSVTRNDVLQAGGGILGFPVQLTIPLGTPGGNHFIIARADSTNAYAESNETNNTLSDAIFVGNTAPSVGAVAVNPNPVGRNGVFTLQALNVTDADQLGNGGLTVRFYYDLDGDNVLSQSADLLIGSGTESNGTFTYRGAVPAAVATGAGKMFALASDGLDSSTANTDFTVVVAPAPTIGDLLGPTVAVRRGRVTSLVATGITAHNTNPDVSFFRDTNGSGVFEEGTDTLLIGDVLTAVDGSRAFDLTIDPAWGPGAQTFFVVATDDLGQSSVADSAVVTLVANQAPRIVGQLTVNKSNLSKGQTLTLTAKNVRDDDGPERVEFYRESSGNSSFSATQDTLLGTGVRSGQKWTLTLTVPVGFRNGLNRFYARAVDIVGDTSAAKTATATITRNTKPGIDAFIINKNTAAVGSRIQFLAQRVIDNAPGFRVEFWYDADLNGRFNANADRLITTGNRLGSSNNFRRQFNLPSDLPSGTARFFAVVTDNLGTRSTKTDTVNLTT